MQSFLEVLSLSWVGPTLYIFGPLSPELLLFIFGLLSPELLLKFKNNYFNGLLFSIKSFCTVSRGPLQRLRSLKTSIGVTAYCLPQDETIGEFGYLLQLF